MWPFSYFRKKREEAIRREEEAKKLLLQQRKEKYTLVKNYIDDIVQTHEDKEYEKRKVYEQEEERKNKESNSKCPNCRHNDIIQIYKRPKGEIHGSLDSHSNHYSSYGPFSGYSGASSHSRGKLDGSLDTLRVNQCKNCGHEWEIKPECITVLSDDYYYGKVDYKTRIHDFLRRVRCLIEDINEFDPSRLDNKYESVNDLLTDKIKNIKWWTGNTVDILTIELIHYYARRYSYDLNYSDKILMEYDYNDGGDNYLGELRPEIEEFITKHFGIKRHFE